MDDHIWSQIQTPWKHLSACYLSIAGNFHDNLISRFLKGDISWHLIFVILENSSKPSHLSFYNFLLSCD